MNVSLFLFLLLLALGLPKAVGFLYLGDGFSLALLHQLPAFPALPVGLNNGLLPLPLLLNLREMAFEVVELIRDPLEVLLRV